MVDQIGVSVVICTYNRSESLKHCLNSVVAQDYKNFEIIIIDDHSEDETLDIVSQYRVQSIKIRIHCNERNMGISYSRNKGVELSSNDIIVFIDDDCIATSEWLTEIVKPFKIAKIAIVGGCIKDPPPINISMIAAMGHYKRFNKEGFCDSLPSGCGSMAVRKNFYMNSPIQNFALEDWELCQQAVNSGYLIYNKPKAIVHHKHYHSLKTLMKQRYRYGLGQTWFRKRYKSTPLNLKTFLFLVAVMFMPIIFIWSYFYIIDLFIFFTLLIHLFLKDLRKGEKTIPQAIISFPIFLLIALSEIYGRIVGLIKKPAQINFGKDHLRCS